MFESVMHVAVCKGTWSCGKFVLSVLMVSLLCCDTFSTLSFPLIIIIKVTWDEGILNPLQELENTIDLV